MHIYKYIKRPKPLYRFALTYHGRARVRIEPTLNIYICIHSIIYLKINGMILTLYCTSKRVSRVYNLSIEATRK